MSVATAPLRVVSRALLGTTFVVLGYQAAREPGGRVKAAEKIGVPMPELAVRANGAAMAIAGGALALGIKPRLSAIALLVLLVPTTLAGHPYWEHEEPQARHGQQVQLLKNAGLAGGLLAVVATPRRRRRRRAERSAEAATAPA